MKLATLQRKVDAIVKKSSQEIIVGVYLKMIDAHNEFCDCDYCELLKKYVKSKIYICKIKRQYYWGDGESQDLWDNIQRHKELIKTLKLQKDTLKLKLH